MNRPEATEWIKTRNVSWVEELTSARGIPTRIKGALNLRLKQALRKIWEFSLLMPVRNHYAGLGSCLLYHRVAASKQQVKEWSPYSGLTVLKENFETQLRYLNDNYNCISLPDAIDQLSEGHLRPKSIVITFDDGYKDNLTVALPLLEKYQIPATIYLTTGLIDRTEELWWFEQEYLIQNASKIDFTWNGQRYLWSLQNAQEKFQTLSDLNRLFKRFRPKQQHSFMAAFRAATHSTYSYDDEILTWDEVAQLDKHPLITLGAHTTSHPMLSLLHKHQVIEELSVSKEHLEKFLGHSIDHFAYPFGASDEIGASEFLAAKRSGFLSAVTTRHGHIYKQHNDFLHVLPRISVNLDDQLESFAWKLSGIHCLLQQYGQRMAVS